MAFGLEHDVPSHGTSPSNRVSPVSADNCFSPFSPTYIHICMQVLIPQHGDKPTLLMEKSNTITVSVSRPCTQLVTIFATARGQRVSTSVLFSMIQDKAAIVSARAPLPADASWGPRSDAVSSLLREPDTDKNNSQILENRAGLLVSPRHDNTDVSTEGTPSPISVVFLGSLYFDGQKHIWLHQMERLSRARFAPKYLTFHEEEGDVGGKSDAEEARFREADDVEIFKRRLRNADVPLVRASLPRMDAGWIAENIDEKTTDNVRMDIGFGVVLESLDSAGGDPHLMSPPWAREVFLVIADAIKRASPDVLVVPNSVTLGDVVITKAARWAMGSRGLKIIMDFPNLQPTHGVDVDLFATPSHYVARHPDVEALAKSTTTPVVVIPPGTEVASAVVLTEEKDVSEHNRSGGPLHDDLACGSDVLKDLGCRDPDCHVRRVTKSSSIAAAVVEWRGSRLTFYTDRSFGLGFLHTWSLYFYTQIVCVSSVRLVYVPFFPFCCVLCPSHSPSLKGGRLRRPPCAQERSRSVFGCS